MLFMINFDTGYCRIVHNIRSYDDYKAIIKNAEKVYKNVKADVAFVYLANPVSFGNVLSQMAYNK